MQREDERQRFTGPDMDSSLEVITDESNITDEWFEQRALAEGEYQLEVTDVFVRPKRDIYGEGFTGSDGESSCATGRWVIPEEPFESDCLGEWIPEQKRQSVHLSYSGDVCFEVEIPSVGVRQFSVRYGRLSMNDVKFLDNIIEYYGGLRNIIGAKMRVQEYEDGRGLLVDDGADVERKTTFRDTDFRETDGRPPYTSVEFFEDIEGAIRYFASDDVWIEEQGMLYNVAGEGKLALAVDVCGATRIFKFPSTKKEGSVASLVIDKYGNGDISGFMAEVQVAAARRLNITREVNDPNRHENGVMITDETGCWVLRHPGDCGQKSIGIGAVSGLAEKVKRSVGVSFDRLV